MSSNFGQARRFATPLDRPTLILGEAVLNSRVGPGAHDIGYWVRSSAVRQGIAAAAVSTLAVHAFGQHGVDRLVIRCDVANTSSAAMARALRFEFIGAETATYPDGAPRPVFRFEMARESYRTQHEPMLRERARRVQLVTDTADM
jgi:RimJ/RimL family protein N-acetyltransferase